jgi:hypothetical protein
MYAKNINLCQGCSILLQSIMYTVLKIHSSRPTLLLHQLRKLSFACLGFDKVTQSPSNVMSMTMRMAMRTEGAVAITIKVVVVQMLIAVLR